MGEKVGQRQKRKAYARKANSVSTSRQINTTLGRNNRMGKCHCIEYVPCANRLMKTGRPGCRTKVNDVINTAVSKRASLADVISFYFFFSPVSSLSLFPSPSFFRSFIRPNKFDRAHVNIVLRVVARREGRGRVGIEGVTNVNWPKKKFYRLSICLGKRAGHCTSPPSPSPSQSSVGK